MMLWIVFALMCVAAVLAVVWPLARKPRAHLAGSDIVVYRDQLEEIGRDRGAGLIGEAEAEAARIEVSRRLLAAADAQAPPPAPQPLWHRRAAALAALIVLPFVPLGGDSGPTRVRARRYAAGPPIDCRPCRAS
jgi:cytochrome c-type biogenesis protein CcmH